MNRKEQILNRKAEIKALLESDTQCDIEEIKRELEDLNTELRTIEEKEAAETRAKENEAMERRNIANQINNNNVGVKERKEEKVMPRNLFDVLKSAEYRSAWLKKMYGMADSQFTEEEKRALGDAITTTATTFVQSTAEVQGINNGGLLIPTTIREDILNNISRTSPFFRDVRKLVVNGIVNLPYLHDADDAAWVEETVCTPNEGMEFKQIQLTGHELVKGVEITWKLEEMAFDSFASFIVEELSNKMGKALAKALLYGTGTNQPTGALTGLSPVTNANPIELIRLTKASLGVDEQIGAKVYLSSSVADTIQFYKDANNSYPYLAGLPRIANLTVEVDPFLNAGDILVGNPLNYIMNENTPIRVDRFVDGRCRKVIFGGYAVIDGKPKANTFALGQLSV